ncbi:hypothetical protein SDC9_151080 [bioreactor metagenome]|uniref:Uncharacterized protein n=1 Tax=bioreactor metagenome TaxID=1076179 RepID=A0A645EQX3_9ZZZZ
MALSVAERLDVKRAGQGVYSFYTHSVEPDGFLECLAVVFGTGVHAAGNIYKGAERDAPPVVPHGNTPLLD